MALECCLSRLADPGVCAVSFVVTVGSLRATSGIETNAGILEQVNGTAHRPFVYRQLVPIIVRAVMAPLPREERIIERPSLRGSRCYSRTSRTDERHDERRPRER